MRILEVCFSPALGGLELYCLNTAATLQQRGHEVSLWLAQGSRMAAWPAVSLQRKLESRKDLDSGHLRGLGPVRRNERLGGISARLFRSPGYVNPFFTIRAKRLIREKGIEVIHLHRSQDLAAFAPINVPKMLTLQIQSSLSKRDLWHRWIYSRVDRILTITHLMRDLAIQSLPISASKVHALHYGIAADELYATRGDPLETRRRLGIATDAFLIGLIGRLEESKGQALLLHAFSQIYQRFPQARLLFAGDPPPQHPDYDRHLRELAQELGIADRVHFVGFQIQTAPIFAALDLFVLASKQEAFGLVLLEAMAQGVSIIATRAGGVPEVIQNGVNGLLVKSGDAAELAGAIVRSIQDAEWRGRLGAAGFRVVREQFGIETHMTALEGHFQDVLNRKDRQESAKGAQK